MFWRCLSICLFYTNIFWVPWSNSIKSELPVGVLVYFMFLQVMWKIRGCMEERLKLAYCWGKGRKKANTLYFPRQRWAKSDFGLSTLHVLSCLVGVAWREMVVSSMFMGWRGPSCISSTTHRRACLTGIAIATLVQKEKIFKTNIICFIKLKSSVRLYIIILISEASQVILLKYIETIYHKMLVPFFLIITYWVFKLLTSKCLKAKCVVFFSCHSIQ